MTGGEANGGIGAEADDPAMQLIRRLEDAGWATGGGIGPQGVNAGFYRREDKLDIGFVEATQKLSILGEDGTVLPGFNVSNDEDTGQVVIGYEGPLDERFDALIEAMVGWGQELEDRLEDALDREPMAGWAGRETDRLRRQISEPANARNIAGEADRRGMSRQDVVAEVTRLALSTMTHRVETDQVPDYLESLFAHVTWQQEGLMDEGGTKPKGSGRYEFNTLAGMAKGIRQELVLRRDEAALAATSEAEAA